MPLNESLKQYPIKDGSITYSYTNTNTYTTVDASSYDSNNVNNVNQKQFGSSTFINTVILVTPVLFVLTTVGVVFYRLKQVKSANLPCKNCKYYNSNNYIKCAVNPVDVQTEKAKDCRDYTTQERKFSWSWKGFNKRH